MGDFISIFSIKFLFCKIITGISAILKYKLLN